MFEVLIIFRHWKMARKDRTFYTQRGSKNLVVRNPKKQPQINLI